MPTSSAALSPVPNRAIAVSFAHDGARSISSDPTTRIGLAAGANRAALSSAAPSPTATAATPAAAGSIHRGALMGAAYVRMP